MVSGYRHPLYDAMLAKWRRVDFRRMDRGGSWALESLWMNYAEPVRLHDFSHLGGDFRARERIKRKRARWRSRLERLPVAERMAMLECLLELASLDVVGSPGMDHTASDGDAGS